MFNTTINSRFEIINKLTNTNDKYLEIGVEYGECFNNVHFITKVGVDPDPKFVLNNGLLYKLTSDKFFEQLFQQVSDNFDVIFIDGMHQCEYVVRDINNSLKVLSSQGMIFIDDILPLNYNEQLKIPLKHYYENGILKYGENWTGDVWKVIYHLLTKYKKFIYSFKYFYNVNYRGVGLFQFNEIFEINDDELEIINNYDYFNDFNKYVSELDKLIIT